jgi:DNA modification methylase
MVERVTEETATTLPMLSLPHSRTCDCAANHGNCLTAGEWLQAQVGVWRFGYERRDVRKKTLHPATFPISLARRCMEVFSHRGELVLDPFVGSGTTLVAARDAGRNALGCDLSPDYVALAEQRLAAEPPAETLQAAVLGDARSLPSLVGEGTVRLILTSPPYANCLDRPRRNKSRRSEDRPNEQFGRVEQYSRDPADLGTLDYPSYVAAMSEVFAGLLPLLAPKGDCLVNVPDIWWSGQRVPLHIGVIEALSGAGYEFRNTIIWDKTNLVNRMGIFGWPSTYITMGVTFEYLLHFRKAPVTPEEG